MMMGLGVVIMVVVLAVPILLIAGLVLLLLKPVLGQAGAQAAATAPPPMIMAPAKLPTAAVCAHCGARLQPEWNNCPQCGAPTGAGH